jgi:predicted PurR-regulated permease PerM
VSSGDDEQPVRSAGPAPRAVLVLVGTAALLVVLLGLHRMAELVAPVFLAMVLVVMVHPLRSVLRGRHVPGWVVDVSLLLVVYGVVAAVVVSLLICASRFAGLLSTYRTEWDQLLDHIGAALAQLGMGPEDLDKMRASLEPGRLLSGLGDALGGLVGLVSMLALVVSVVFFMTLDAGWFAERLDSQPERRRQLADALGSFAAGTRRYLLISTVFGFAVAVLDTLALWWIGVPAAVLWGMLAFVTNYIPNIGFFIGLVPPVVLALLEGGPGMAILVAALYIAINFVLQSLIQPRVVGSAVGLSGTVTMLSLVFWAAALGALGALLAVPLTLFARALLVAGDPSTARLTGLLAPHPEDTTDRLRRARPRWSRHRRRTGAS